jgi:hypothetical protein
MPDLQHNHVRHPLNQRWSNEINHNNDHARTAYLRRRTMATSTSAWVQRYKSMHQSHTLTNILREDLSCQDQILLRKGSYLKACLLSSLNKRSRVKCS